jgi:hypothetical protein
MESKWKLAFDILIGAAAPSVEQKDYGAAAVIAGIGYFLLPALIGVAVTVVISVLARLGRDGVSGTN